jgi:hypothetical protein
MAAPAVRTFRTLFFPHTDSRKWILLRTGRSGKPQVREKGPFLARKPGLCLSLPGVAGSPAYVPFHHLACLIDLLLRNGRHFRLLQMSEQVHESLLLSSVCDRHRIEIDGHEPSNRTIASAFQSVSGTRSISSDMSARYRQV